MTKRTTWMRRRKNTKFLALVAACLSLCPFTALGADKKKAPALAVIAGTVFRDSGFALAGAEVSIVAAGEDQAKKKKWSAATDSRGEFAVRVPASPSEGYNVGIKANGFEPQAQSVKPHEGERVELNFVLNASK